jgi:hypothetical protein
VKDFEQVLREAERAVVAASYEAVREVCDDLLSGSRDEVPYDQGDLSNSGKVTVLGDSTEVEGAVSFDTPYAVRQHEDPELRHQDGRKAKFLGDPLREKSSQYMQYIADKVRRAHGG